MPVPSLRLGNEERISLLIWSRDWRQSCPNRATIAPTRFSSCFRLSRLPKQQQTVKDNIPLLLCPLLRFRYPDRYKFLANDEVDKLYRTFFPENFNMLSNY
jgi:hypothetical protein